MSSPEYEQLLLNLKRLRLGSLTESLEGHLKRAAATNMSYQDFLSGLVHEALEHRQQRGVALRIKKAKFPFQKRLEDFDFAFQPSLNRQKVKALASLKFVDQRENVIFLGPPGVGKTHLAVALGLEACETSYKVAFTTLHDLVNELHASLADRSLAERLQALSRPHILIIDEVGYLPLDKERANYFFQVVARRYEQGSIILTSNKSFTDWGTALGDGVIASAILDRLLHHSTVFNIRGQSYRLKEKRDSVLKEEVAMIQS